MPTQEKTVCRQSAYAMRKREAIFEVLGRRCAKCGARQDLSFDVVIPIEEDETHHHKQSWSARMSFYCRQLAAGNLQVLCDVCNTSKGRKTTRHIVPLITTAQKNPF